MPICSVRVEGSHVLPCPLGQVRVGALDAWRTQPSGELDECIHKWDQASVKFTAIRTEHRGLLELAASICSVRGRRWGWGGGVAGLVVDGGGGDGGGWCIHVWFQPQRASQRKKGVLQDDWELANPRQF